MGSVNKVILIGRLGKDPEIRATQNGGKVANLTLATSESWNNKQTGQREEKTEWHKLVAFGNTAEIMEKYLAKGSQIYVEGRLSTRKWTDKDNQDRYTTEITVDNMTMLGSKDEAKPETSYSNPKSISKDEPFDDVIPF